MPILTEICYRLARRRVLGRRTGDAGENAATFDADAYHDWRSSELTNQFDKHFRRDDVEGFDVLDFGCGQGDLSFLVSNYAPKSITGVEVQEGRRETAAARAEKLELPVKPEFHLASCFDKIDFPDASFDRILCFDVLEHIMDYEAIIPEWNRILRPGGKLLIWWVPWFHPYGHHVESLVPLPWVHAVFPDSAVIGACEKVYDMPEFKPRLWDLDENGVKKPNKWRDMKVLPEVNRLTIGRFEKIAKRSGLKVTRREAHGFGGGGLAAVTRLFTKLPLAREFFTSFMIYEIEKA